ncbi:MAG: hypothetical protein AAGG07_11405 [Planctomycetota bacterium]
MIRSYRAAMLAALSISLAPVAAALQPTAPTAIELSDRQVVLDGSGLGVMAPIGATVQRIRGGAGDSLQLTAPDQSWLINVQAPRTSNPEHTVASVAKTIQQQVLQTRTSGGRAKLISSDADLTLAGEPAARFYARIPQTGGKAVVRGYTVRRISADRFATFELITTEQAFESSRPVFELVAASAPIGGPQSDIAAKSQAADDGRAFLASLTNSDYEAAINVNHDRWDRLAVPAATGSDADATELSYRRTRARAGRLGEVAPRDADASSTGYLVQIDSRFLGPEGPIDSQGVFFMTEDRSREVWTVKLAVPDPNSAKPVLWTETGSREGDRVTVTIRGGDGADTVHSPRIAPDLTLTQVERFLLPTLISVKGSVGMLGFDAWSSRDAALVFRTETIEPSGTGLRIAAIPSEGERPQVTIVDGEGGIVRTTLPGGAHEPDRVWAPVRPKRLAKLWRDKGLPLD